MNKLTTTMPMKNAVCFYFRKKNVVFSNQQIVSITVFFALQMYFKHVFIFLYTLWECFLPPMTNMVFRTKYVLLNTCAAQMLLERECVLVHDYRFNSVFCDSFVFSAQICAYADRMLTERERGKERVSVVVESVQKKKNAAH